jgi:hypothetical protein
VLRGANSVLIPGERACAERLVSQLSTVELEPIGIGGEIDVDIA